MGQICSFCGSKEESSKSGAFADTTSSDIPESHHSQQHPLSSSPYHPNADGSLSALNNGANNAHHLQGGSGHEHDPHLYGPASDPNNPAGSAHDGPGGMDAMDENERQRRLKQYQLEQAELARREAIVNAASQSMVPVGGSQGNVGGVGGGGNNGGGGMMMNSAGRGGGGGINTYYDPAYAAAAAQDILNSAARSGGMVFADDAATRAAWQMSVSVMGVMPVPSSRNGSSKDVMDALGKGQWDGIKLGSRGSGVAGCGGENPEYYLDDLAEAFLEMMVPSKTTLFGGCPSIVENLP